MSTIRLTAQDQAHLLEAQRLLLSPLAASSEKQWQLRCNEASRTYLHAEHSAFSIPSSGDPPLSAGGSVLPPVYSNDTPDAFERGVHSAVTACFSSDWDPYLSQAIRRRLERGLGAYHIDELMTPEQQAMSPAVHDVFSPAGMRWMIGLSLALPEGEATQWLGFERRDAAGFSSVGVRKLQLLVPAFVRGVGLLRASLDREGSLLAHLDGLRQPIALYDSSGRPKHRNRALRSLLADEPEADRIGAAMDDLAMKFVVRSRGSQRAQDPVGLEVERRIDTRARSFALWGGYGPTVSGGDSSVLVQLKPLGPVLPRPQTVRKRYGLTAREAEVALLLAQGHSDKAVARSLDISWHTARTYTKNILGKLEVSSRAEIGLALLRNGPKGDSGQSR